MATFGERLRLLRQSREETQGQIAKLLNIGTRMISHYENDEHFPRDAESLKTLAAHFNVTTDYLLGYSDIQSYSELARFHRNFISLSEENKKEVKLFAGYLKWKKENN